MKQEIEFTEDEIATDQILQYFHYAHLPHPERSVALRKRLEEDKAAIAEDIKEVYAEAKGEGFDTRVMRQLIRERKKEPHEVREFQMLLDLYGTAIGEMPTKKQKVRDALH